jgi:hypothetical protein
LSASAFAQGGPATVLLPDRCTIDHIVSSSAAAVPCKPDHVGFGLTGPVASSKMDVDVTASVPEMAGQPPTATMQQKPE